MEADVLGEVEGVPSDGELDADELGDDEAVDEGDVEGLLEPEATYSSAPISQVPVRVVPSMSVVKVAERSVPASTASDVERKCKSVADTKNSVVRFCVVAVSPGISSSSVILLDPVMVGSPD